MEISLRRKFFKYTLKFNFRPCYDFFTRIFGVKIQILEGIGKLRYPFSAFDFLILSFLIKNQVVWTRSCKQTSPNSPNFKFQSSYHLTTPFLRLLHLTYPTSKLEFAQFGIKLHSPNIQFYFVPGRDFVPKRCILYVGGILYPEIFVSIYILCTYLLTSLLKNQVVWKNL